MRKKFQVGVAAGPATIIHLAVCDSVCSGSIPSRPFITGDDDDSNELIQFAYYAPLAMRFQVSSLGGLATWGGTGKQDEIATRYLHVAPVVPQRTASTLFASEFGNMWL